MIDIKQAQIDYAKAYADKTRIFFIEKYLSTFNATAGKSTPFTLFPRQKAFLKSLAENKASIAIKHRQAGITTITSAWVTAQIVFAETNAPETVLCIGNKMDIAQQLLDKIREFLLQVPRWYWGDDYYSADPKSPKNKKSIFIKNSKGEIELFNGCRVCARSSGPNASRGISAVTVLIFDEAAFIENGLDVYSSAVAATASVPKAKIIMISTPNGKDALYYNTYRQALSKENNYHAVEFKWFQDLRYNRFLTWHKKNLETGEDEVIKENTLNEQGDIKYDEERWRKLESEGWIPRSPWYENMCKSFNNDSMRIAQELDVSFMGSANNVVASEFIEQQEKLNVREPLEDMVDPMVNETWFWKPPIDKHRYIIACLPEKEKVITIDGLKAVENIDLNDKLYTIDGKVTNIKKIFKRQVINEEIYKFSLYGLLNKLSFTYNHPIYIYRNGEKEFIEAENVKNNDYVLMPLNLENHNYKFEGILQDEKFWELLGLIFFQNYTINEQYLQVHINNKILNICKILHIFFYIKQDFIYIKNTKILNILKNKYILMYLEENNLRSFLKNFNINLFKTKNKKNIELIQFLLSRKYYTPARLSVYSINHI